MNAGVDMEMVSRLFNEHGPALLNERKWTQATVDEAVRRILRIKFRLGLFERPYVDESLEKTAYLTAESRRGGQGDRGQVDGVVEE